MIVDATNGGKLMDRRAKAAMNRDRAPTLNEVWGVGAVQSRYHDKGRWYARLERFPAALFDPNGYILFKTEEEYLTCPDLQIGKQITVRKGISGILGYREFSTSAMALNDPDLHGPLSAEEGQRRLVLHLKCERSQAVVRLKKKASQSLECEICGFSFGRVYGHAARDYCEVHHLIPVSTMDEKTKTHLEDLVILCSNCHRVAHLRQPEPYTLSEVRAMLAGDYQEPQSPPVSVELLALLDLL